MNRYLDQRNHCPLGCGKDQLDERGYCCHLVGFTNQGKKLERLQYNDQPPEEEGKKVRSMIAVQVRHDMLEPVLRTDILVNPERPITDGGGTHIMKEWSSARVYRKCSKEEADAWREKHAHVVEDEESELVEQA